MAVAYWLALQAASAPAPIDFDLARLDRPRYGLADRIAARRCDRDDGGTIVVCGRREAGAYPMAEWALIFPPEGPLRAETGLGGGALASLDAETVGLDRGAVTNRFMVTFKFPF